MIRNRWSLSGLLALAVVGLIHAPVAWGQSSRNNADSVVVVSGVGRDETEATSAAFREAIARVVGTWVESDFIVKNNVVVRDDLREHSSGFIRSYRILESGQTPDGRVHITLRARVERTAVQKPIRATRIVLNIHPNEIEAETATRAETRRTAAKLLAALFADLPKLVKVDVPHRPTRAGRTEGMEVSVTISVDEESYGRWGRRAVALLERIAVAKEGLIVGSDRLGPVDWQIREPFRNALLVHRTWSNPPPGFAIGLLTDRDRGWGRTRWAFYWVDADLSESLAPLTGTPQLHLEARDFQGTILAQVKLPLLGPVPDSQSTSKTSSNRGWLVFHIDSRKNPSRQDPAPALFIGPIASTLGVDETATGGRFTPILAVRQTLPMNSKLLSRVNEISAFVRWE